MKTLAGRMFQPYLIPYQEGQFHRHLVCIVLFSFVCFNWNATFCLLFFFVYPLLKNIKVNDKNNTQAAHFTEVSVSKRFSKVSLFLFMDDANFPLVFECTIWRQLRLGFSILLSAGQHNVIRVGISSLDLVVLWVLRSPFTAKWGVSGNSFGASTIRYHIHYSASFIFFLFSLVEVLKPNFFFWGVGEEVVG